MAAEAAPKAVARPGKAIVEQDAAGLRNAVIGGKHDENLIQSDTAVDEVEQTADGDVGAQGHVA